MNFEEQIESLKHQIHEMDQDIKNYLSQIDELENENSILRSKVKSYTQAILSRTTQNEF